MEKNERIRFKKNNCEDDAEAITTKPFKKLYLDHASQSLILN